jgi:serine/threonine-protein kinase RsbT
VTAPAMLPELRVDIREDVDVAVARRGVRDLGRQIGLTPTAVEEMAAAVSEIARNILVHGQMGEITMAMERLRSRRCLAVVARDRGPGIVDPERAFADGYSTGGSLGLGLAAARRLVDEFQLESGPDQGTTVVMKKWAP